MHLFTWSGVSVVNTWQYCRFICPLGSLARKENWQWSGSQVAYAIRFNSWNMYSVWGKRPTANTLQLAREKQRNSKLATKYYSPLYSSFLRKCWYLFLNVIELMKKIYFHLTTTRDTFMQNQNNTRKWYTKKEKRKSQLWKCTQKKSSKNYQIWQDQGVDNDKTNITVRPVLFFLNRIFTKYYKPILFIYVDTIFKEIWRRYLCLEKPTFFLGLILLDNSTQSY